MTDKQSTEKRWKGKAGMLSTLGLIAEKLNEKGIVWAVGGSVMLSYYGLAPNPHDIDILIGEDCAAQAAAVMKAIGKERPPAQSRTFVTRHYHQYTVSSFAVDVMSGMAIWHDDGLFCYIFDKKSVTGCMAVSGVDVPLASLEDWYVLYQLMPGRDAKVNLIEGYLKSDGIRRPELLKRMLAQNLPQRVMENIKRLLDEHLP